jgi:hypothetical protein
MSACCRSRARRAMQTGIVRWPRNAAPAEIEGTYNLVDQKLDLRGVLHTSGKLADTKSAWAFYGALTERRAGNLTRSMQNTSRRRSNG